MDREFMSNPLMTPRLEFSKWEPKLQFDLVVAYEDTHTRNRAMHLYDHLAQQLLDDYDFQCSWWKFDHLRDVSLREQAADAASDAHMVILSVHARHELLTLHQEWIEEWVPRRDHRKAALVALVAGEDNLDTESAPMLTYLRQASRLAHMDFFTHAFNSPELRKKFSTRRASEQAAEVSPVSTTETVFAQRITIPRWGINE